mgnify:CR=1 FL=1
MKTKDYDNKMVRLEDISEDARGLLVKAHAYRTMPWAERIQDKGYLDLYTEFLRETRGAYKTKSEEFGGESLSRFEVAITRMDRRIKTLNYKNAEHQGFDDLMRK